MSSQLLTFFKYLFLVVLYLFFLRVLRAVWIELREPKPAAPGAAATLAPEPPAPPRPTRRQRRSAPGALVVVDPVERAGQRFELGDELTVGRAPGCGVSLPDDTFVSQLHARVFRRDGELYVEDLGSTNGTYLNGGRVAAAVALQRGDKLQVGKTTMELQT